MAAAPKSRQHGAVRSLLLLLACAACAPTPEAPAELSDLNRYLLREFDNPDPAFLEAGTLNLREHLRAVDPAADLGDRAWQPTHLTEEDVADMARPDVPLDGTVNVGVAALSIHPLHKHARYMTEVDQRPAEPTATEYERRFLDPTDPTCFPEQECLRLNTFNLIRRENALFRLNFELFKDLQQVRIGGPDHEPEAWAMVARSWIQEPFTGDNGGTVMQQSFTLDTWVEDPDQGGTWRYQALWSETDLGDGDIDEGLIRGTMRLGIDGNLENADEAITEAYGDE
jgi:hypothetical protein